MIKNSLHEQYCQKNAKLKEWYAAKSAMLATPIYSSYDIRDSGFKVANVDANIFPAGFNNICPTDKDYSIELFSGYFSTHYGDSVERVLLVTEEHTNNPYYWENVLTIKSLIESGGRKVLIGVPRVLDQPLKVKSVSGMEIAICSADLGSPEVIQFQPQLILSNNDFSNSHEEWSINATLPMNPPRELGWYQRKKSTYFECYNSLVNEFAAECGLDPFLLNVKTRVFSNFSLAEDANMSELAREVDIMIVELREEYARRKIVEEPTIFIKNNAGTYGLAVIQVRSGAEILEWNYKSRKKMKAAKGGRDVEEVIIQEGISSRVEADGATAEPVIYMIGCELAGGFLRSHADKTKYESLNSPGAVYKRLCVSDLNVQIEGAPLENVYGWSARLGLLAIGLESQKMGVQYKAYRLGPC